MPSLVYQLIEQSARNFPSRCALKYHDEQLNYEQLFFSTSAFAAGLMGLGLNRTDRVAVYAEKRFETVIAMFGSAQAGLVYVPINPLLKSEQVAYILTDCDVRVLVTTSERLLSLTSSFSNCPNLKAVVCMGTPRAIELPNNIELISWIDMQKNTTPSGHRVIDQDMAAILYTSGSTGLPKGVVLSHRNIVAGAESVAEYLQLTNNDSLLSVLPLSFDYGMNQLTTMFLTGGSVVLMNYLFPKDIITLLEKEKITGLAAVPPLWIQLSRLKWPPTITEHLRYFTNSGGHMPKETLQLLRNALPKTKPYLMYGLTESFRSTYLPPSEIDKRPDSMGKAIPNAEIFVVGPDGKLCQANQPGELVHRGALVSLGYWNDPIKTAERFKPLPDQNKSLPLTEMAVWSGDTVKMDEDGYLYFVSRKDEMIKTTGYRVSPTEVEEFIYNTHLVDEVVAFGIFHPVLGQVIGVVATAAKNTMLTSEGLKLECQKHLPNYMVPSHIEIVTDHLPRNANGKIDRKTLALTRQDLFKDQI